MMSFSFMKIDNLISADILCLWVRPGWSNIALSSGKKRPFNFIIKFAVNNYVQPVLE